MRLHEKMPRAALALGLLAAPALAVNTQNYCSSENTGSDYNSAFSIYNSFDVCSKECSNYAFAVVQYQSCWCSNYIPQDQQSVSSCSQGCPGYDYEHCGNEDNGLFGYFQLSTQPSGTAGGGAQSTSSSSEDQPTTESSTYNPPSSTEQSSTPESTTSSESPTTSSSSKTTLFPISSVTDSSTTHRSATPVVSTRVVTISGAITTQTVTTTPIPASGESGDPKMHIPTREDSLSSGAIAGIVIGALAGLALLLLGAFFLWRRNRKTEDDGEGSSKSGRFKRTTSVLSKTGLISRSNRRPSMTERDYDDHNGSVRTSMLFNGTAGGAAGTAGGEVSNNSPLGSTVGGQTPRRNSQPLVYDQRLNPSALFANAEANGSRVSMQDMQDYSRPLGVMNPDPRSSFESRVSRIER